MRELYKKVSTTCIFTGKKLTYVGLRAGIIFNIGCCCVMSVTLVDALIIGAFWYHIPFFLLLLVLSNVRSAGLLKKLRVAEKLLKEAKELRDKYESAYGEMYEETRRTHTP